jgi:hypothetical protein
VSFQDIGGVFGEIALCVSVSDTHINDTICTAAPQTADTQVSSDFFSSTIDAASIRMDGRMQRQEFKNVIIYKKGSSRIVHRMANSPASQSRDETKSKSEKPASYLWLSHGAFLGWQKPYCTASTLFSICTIDVSCASQVIQSRKGLWFHSTVIFDNLFGVSMQEDVWIRSARRIFLK